MEISIETPKSNFATFIQDAANKRIFFSGKYGVGKTFFLQKFFEDRKDHYDVYHLFPVRYQIASNENIIELLKYDLIVELCKKYPQVLHEGNSISLHKTIAAFCYEKGLGAVVGSAAQLGASIASMIPDPNMQALSALGRGAAEIVKLGIEFKNFRETSAPDLEKLFTDLAKDLEKINGLDAVSADLAKNIKTLKEAKKSVLILDDFDRIDPEHTFRILNLLSQNGDDEGNKFEFDHIVIVGNHRNIKSIFHHKYGKEAEFEGYFDKFFSVTPFHFNNRSAVQEWMRNQKVGQIKCEEPNLLQALGEGGVMSLLLEDMLIEAFDINKLSLRQLFKPHRYAFPEVGFGSYTGGRQDRAELIDRAIRVFSSIVGDKVDADDILRRIADQADASTEDALSKKVSPYLAGRLVTSMSSGEADRDMVSIWANGQEYRFRIMSVVDDNVVVAFETGATASRKMMYDLMHEYAKKKLSA